MPESNVILEYLEEAFPDPALAPPDAYGRAKMRLVDQAARRGCPRCLGRDPELRHRVPAPISRTRRARKNDARADTRTSSSASAAATWSRKGPQSKHFVIAVERMVLLLDEMEEALVCAPMARRRRLQLGRRGVYALPRPARASGHSGHDRRATSSRRLVSPLQGAAELPRCHRQVGECRLPRPDEAARRRGLAAGSGDHAGAMSLPARRQPAESEIDARKDIACWLHDQRAASSCWQLSVLAGARAARVGADLSDAEHQLAGRLRGRRHRRCDRAAGGPKARRAARADRRGREPRRRRRQSRRQVGERCGARRLHHAHHDLLALAVSETATKNKGFSVDDLRPIAIVALSPDVIAVHPSNPAKDLTEFIANGKKKSFTYGSAGVGTGPHIGAEYFFREVAKVQGRARAVHRRRAGGRAPHRQPRRRAS